jgi:uncharacterized membrane protein (DUF2068 family)
MTLSYFDGAGIERSGSLSQPKDIATRRSSPEILRLLAVYYLVQGLLLVTVGVGGLLLVDQNHLLVIKQWLQIIHLDPENRSVLWLLTKVLPIADKRLEILSIGSFVYAGLAFVQGRPPIRSAIGLLSHGSRGRFFIPWELYGMLDHVTPLRLTTLGINAGAHLVSPREKNCVRNTPRKRRKLPYGIEQLAGHGALNAFAYSDLVRQPQPVPRGSGEREPGEAAKEETQRGSEDEIVLRSKDSLFVESPFYVWKFAG